MSIPSSPHPLKFPFSMFSLLNLESCVLSVVVLPPTQPHCETVLSIVNHDTLLRVLFVTLNLIHILFIDLIRCELKAN